MVGSLRFPGNRRSPVVLGISVQVIRMGRERLQQRFGVVLLAALVLASSGCSSSPSGPSDSARAICTAVGQQLGAPPGLNARAILTPPVVAADEHSSDARLNAAVSHLSQALDRQRMTAILGAESEIETACARLGIWRVYHQRCCPGGCGPVNTAPASCPRRCPRSTAGGFGPGGNGLRANNVVRLPSWAGRLFPV